MNLRLVLLFGAGFLVLCATASTKQKITSLPGLSPFPENFQQFGGYITVNQTAGKEYYYWFVESASEPSSDPVLLWLQGGPGCSGLLGFWQENGPFQLQPDGTVTSNPYSWNARANIIYVEQPAGVGFSYAGASSDYKTNDNQTAVDNLAFLEGWMAEFPQFSKNQLWLTGESYAGVYIPTLANQILDNGTPAVQDAFQGFMLGNPVLHCPFWIAEANTIVMNNWYWHGLVSYANRAAWFQNNCQNEASSTCNQLYNSMADAIGPYDGDDLYQNFCTGNATLDFIEKDSEGTCQSLSDLLDAYLNRVDVQNAIHAKPPVYGTWTDCNDRVAVEYGQLGQNMLDYYHKFFREASLRILVYNGDIDTSTVPHAYTQICLSGLDRPIVKPWSRWTVPGPNIVDDAGGLSRKSNITAGYQEVYDKYSFATVRGAGHEVPTYQPLFAYNMFERFIIEGKDL